MRILVVAHKQSNHQGGYYDFPLGIAYVSSALKNSGFQVQCLNLNHYEDHFDVLRKTIQDAQIEVICFGGLSAHFSLIKELLDFVKKIAPHVISIVGGGLITSEPELVYGMLESDYGVIGEGEETAPQLIEALERKTSVADVDGVIFRDKRSGEIIRTNPRKLIQDIDQIPFPDFEGFEIEKYISQQRTNDIYYFHVLDSKPRMLPIISSRGCPYNCSFCFHPLGRQYRVRSLDNFFAELELLINNYDINYFCVYDELLSANKQRIQEFCRRMETYNVKWMTQLRVDSVDEELLLLLKKSGVTCISYGIESANNTVLKSMKKNITIEQVERALEMTRANKIGIQGNLIFGDRAETEETVAQSLAWHESHGEYLLGLGMISAFPGSSLYKYAKEKNLIPDLDVYLRRGGGGAINVTAMSDAQYKHTFVQSYYVARKTLLKHHVKPEKLVLVDKNDKGESTYEFSVHCPHCNTDNEYKDFNVSSNWCVLVCKTCYQRHYISFQRFQLLKNYGEVFIYAMLRNLPPRLSYFLYMAHRYIVLIQNYTWQEAIVRIWKRFRN